MTDNTAVNTQAQVEDLQSRVSFQEDTLQVLSEQLAQQGSELQTLRTQMQILNKKMGDLLQQLEAQAGPAASERPPHY